MVITPNSQAAVNANAVKPSVAAAPKRQESASQPTPLDSGSELSITPRNNSADLAEIQDEEAAADTAQFARKHILVNPSGALGVQANSRPEVVFELLQGILS